jgi:hypothetical protein
VEPADRAADGRVRRLTTASDIQLRAKVAPLAIFYYFTKPQVSVDGGAPFPVAWGVNQLTVPPGRHRVQVWFRYFLWSKANFAELDVDVPVGGVVAMTYKSRWTVLVAGRLALD